MANIDLTPRPEGTATDDVVAISQEIVQLYGDENHTPGNERYPVTVADAVITSNGKTLAVEFSEEQAARTTAFNTSEAQRTATFNSKEAERDAAMATIESEAETLTELSQKVNEFDEDINGSETTTTTTEPIQKTGKYYNMNGVNVGSTFNPSAPNSSTGNVCYKLEVNVGDTFYIYGISKSAYVGMYAITNSNNVVTEILHDTTSNYRAIPKKIVIAESGYLYINHGNYDAATDKVEREIVTDVKGISEKVSDLEGAVYGEEAIVYDKTYNVVANGGISLEYSNISLESENDYIITIEDEANVLKSLATCYLKPTDGSSLVSFTIYSNIPYPLHTTKAYSQIGLYLASGNGNIVKNGSFKLQVKDKTNAVDGVEQKIEKIGYNTLSNKTIVLCGDSQVGQAGYFAEYLAKFVGAKVLNCGFGGCRYAWRTSDGTDSYDAFSAIGVADALTSKDFTAMDNALVAIGNDAPPHYAVSIANLKSLNLVDGANCILTLAYGSNDFSGGNSLGTAESQDKATMLGAMQYTIEKLLVAYPKLQVIVVGLPYRVYANTGTTITSDSDTYVKTIDGTAYHRYDYSDAILDNARANHLPCFDMYRRSGRNKYNVFEICGDGTHPTTAYGQQLTAELYAKMLTSF